MDEDLKELFNFMKKEISRWEGVDKKSEYGGGNEKDFRFKINNSNGNFLGAHFTSDTLRIDIPFPLTDEKNIFIINKDPEKSYKSVFIVSDETIQIKPKKAFPNPKRIVLTIDENEVKYNKYQFKKEDSEIFNIEYLLNIIFTSYLYLSKII